MAFRARFSPDDEVIASSIQGSLITVPAERWDVLVDFSGFAGKRIIMYTDAPAPFPSGDSSNDYFPGAPENPTQPTPGFGANTRQIMAFDVARAISGPPDLPLQLGSANFTGAPEPFLVVPGVTTPAPGLKVRTLTLNESFDQYGRLIQMLGTDVPAAGQLGREYIGVATETPHAGATEVWQIVNTTGDTHPIHFHLINVQVLSRRRFDASAYTGRSPA